MRSIAADHPQSLGPAAWTYARQQGGFRFWIHHIVEPPDGPASDFVEDARGVTDLPDATTWRQLWTYLLLRHACREAISTGRCVWREYRRWRRIVGRGYAP